jgi:hypothetical protein
MFRNPNTNTSAIPFVAPPATGFNNLPAAYSAWQYFSTYAQAVQMLQSFNSAAKAAGAVSVSLDIVDGIANMEDGMFHLTGATPNNPPQPGDVTCWHIEGSFTVDGMTYVVNEWVGSLVWRSVYPTAVDFAGSAGSYGGPNLYFHLLVYGPVGLAEAFWNQ